MKIGFGLLNLAPLIALYIKPDSSCVRMWNFVWQCILMVILIIILILCILFAELLIGLVCHDAN